MTKTKTSKRLSLSEKNKKFWALPAAKKRVAVAKDVIRQINNGFYNPKTGTYFRPDDFKGDIEAENAVKLDVALTEIGNRGGHCTVCGIGGCFVSLARLGDKIKTEAAFGELVEAGDEPSDYFMKRKLRKIFSSTQLSMIECAFEMYDGHGDAHYQKRELAADWGNELNLDSRNRLIAIMKNIIKNKGEFIPVLKKVDC